MGVKKIRVSVNALAKYRDHLGKHIPELGRVILANDLFSENYLSREVDLDDFIEIIRSNGAFCSLILPGKTRHEENVESIEFVAVDIDEGRSLADVRSDEFVRSYGTVIYTTTHHRREKRTASGAIRPPCDRFRIVFFLDEPIPREEFKRSIEGLVRRFGSDSAPTNPASLFWGNRDADIERIGQTLPLSVLRSLATPESRPRRSTTPVFREFPPEEVLEMLRRISPTGQGLPYETWRNCVFAVLDEFGEDGGRSILDSWTTFREGEFSMFVRGDMKRGGARVGLGTVIQYARDAGYLPPASEERLAQYIGTIPPDVQRLLASGSSDFVPVDAFVRLYGSEVAYTDNTQTTAGAWYSWSGVRWEDGRIGPAKRAEGVVRAWNELRPRGRGRPAGPGFVPTVLQGAQATLYRPAEDFNTRNVIVFQNCAVDLDTVEIIPITRDLMNTVASPISYDPKEESELFHRFIETIFVDADGETDPELVEGVQRAIGYSLLTRNPERKFLILRGGGSNGKSQFIRILTKVLGGYAVMIQGKMFTTAVRDDENRVERELYGVRVCLTDEISDGSRFNVELIKRITGGERLAGSRKFENRKEFDSTAFLVFAVNQLPKVFDDPAFFSRPLVVPMLNSFENSPNEIKDISELILKTPSVPVSWMLEGLRKYRGLDGYDPGLLLDRVKAVREATKAYRDDSDRIGKFLDDETERDDRGEVRSSELYSRFRSWCIDQGVRDVDQTTFKNAVLSRGVGFGERHEGRYFLGLRLRPRADENEQKALEF